MPSPPSSRRRWLCRSWVAIWFTLTSQSSPVLIQQLPNVWVEVTASSPVLHDGLMLDSDAAAADSDSTQFNMKPTFVRKHDNRESITKGDAATACASAGNFLWHACNYNYKCNCKHFSSRSATGAATVPPSSANGSRTAAVRETNQKPKRRQNGMLSCTAPLVRFKGGATQANRSKTRNRLEVEDDNAATVRRNSGWTDVRHILRSCAQQAGRGGLPGAAAGLLQVVTLMWLRTVVNYQCRYGTSMAAATRELYRQGGILRFYRGVSFALISNPLSRFGMAAANEGALALSDAFPRPVSLTFTTWIASLLAGIWRIVLTPLDTCKTVLQVEGSKGFALLMKKVWGGNVGCLYQGAMAASTATAVGYFPWFLVFNYLNARLKIPAAASAKLLRSAGIGLAASVTSDLCTNSIRVLKTTKQAAAAYDKEVTYRGAAALVIEADGWGGLLGRGLSTRILANGLQSMLFTVVWRYLHEKYVAPKHSKSQLALEARSGQLGLGGKGSRPALNIRGGANPESMEFQSQTCDISVGRLAIWHGDAKAQTLGVCVRGSGRGC